jgi:hypothetical protein
MWQTESGSYFNSGENAHLYFLLVAPYELKYFKDGGQFFPEFVNLNAKMNLQNITFCFVEL